MIHYLDIQNPFDCPTIIKSIILYESLEEYLKIEGYDNVLPYTQNFDNALSIYNRVVRKNENLYCANMVIHSWL